MASAFTVIPIYFTERKVAKNITATVTLEIKPSVLFRIGLWFIRIGRFISGIGYKEVSDE